MHIFIYSSIIIKVYLLDVYVYFNKYILKTAILCRASVADWSRALSYTLHELRGSSLVEATSLLLFEIYYSIFELFSIRHVCFLAYPLTADMNVGMIQTHRRQETVRRNVFDNNFLSTTEQFPFFTRETVSRRQLNIFAFSCPTDDVFWLSTTYSCR